MHFKMKLRTLLLSFLFSSQFSSAQIFSKDTLNDGWAYHAGKVNVTNIHILIGGGPSAIYQNGFGTGGVGEILVNSRASIGMHQSIYTGQADSSGKFNMRTRWQVKFFTSRKRNYGGFYAGAHYSLISKLYVSEISKWDYTNSVGIVSGYRILLNKRWMLEFMGVAGYGWTDKRSSYYSEAVRHFFDGSISAHICFVFPKMK
jgi:hypothetical protein